jgi:hypothetical protein
MFKALIVLAIAAAPAIARSQSSAAVADTASAADRNVVTSYSVKSGRLMLSSAANPGPVAMPDGTYTNESGIAIVFLEGSITRLVRGESISEISNMRVNRQKLVVLTPSTNALMAVSDINLPSGTFKLPDESSWIRVIIGRPAEFLIAAPTPRQ